MVAAAVAAAATVLALAGCTPGASTSSSASPTSPRPVASGSATASTPAPSATALPADVLLRVSAVATDAGGATAHLVLTAHVPSDGDGSEPAAMSAAQCDDSTWQTDTPAPRQWIRLDLDATAPTGDWPHVDGIGVETGSGQRWQAWTGGWALFESDCAPGFAVIPGSAQGVEPVSSTASTTDRSSWLFAPWGFDWMDDAPTIDRPPFTFTSCTIELGPAAESYAATLTRTPPVAGQTADDSCEFGPAYH